MAMTGEDALFLSKKYTDKTVAEAQLGGGGSDIPNYATPEYVDEKTEGLVSEEALTETLGDYVKTENLPEPYNDSVLSGRVSDIEDDYLKSTDKQELTDAIATAKREAIETVVGENVNADFDTLQEVADWIQSDTTGSAELVTRVTNAENDIDALEEGKVDKVTGKGLSTNDFTDGLKEKYDEAYEHSQVDHAPLKLSEFADILPLKNGGTGLSFAEFYELIEELLYNADGITNTVGIGNTKVRQSGSTSRFNFWKTNNNTRIECKASTSGNYIVDALTIYTALSGNSAFPSLIIDYNVKPGLDNEGDLGGPDNRWCNIYSATGTISTSDRNKKKDIESLDADKTIDFIMGLNPVSYKFIDGESGRTHHGLISQEVEELLERLGMSSMDFAGFIKSPKIAEDGSVIEGEYNYALRQGEFIADIIKMVQIQQNEIADLKAIVEELRNK